MSEDSIDELKKELIKEKLKGITCPKCHKVLIERNPRGQNTYLFDLYCKNSKCTGSFEIIVNVSRDRIWECTNNLTSPEYTYQSYLEYRKDFIPYGKSD